MDSEDLRSKVKAAQEAVKGTDKDLRKTAFEIVLKRLLEGGPSASAKAEKRTKRTPASRKAKKAPSVSTAPIPLNLKGGKNIPRLKDFYAEKAPKTNQERVTVFTYYVNKHLGIADVLEGHIISCYNEVREKKPLEIVQLFRDIKHRKGWVESGEAPKSAKISIAGENLVEHDLRRSKK